MIAVTRSLGIFGSGAYAVTVEADVARGLPRVSIVGLPDQAVRESRDRIEPAIKNSGFPFPRHRLTVNLAPAERKKEGPILDLAIAVGVLAAAAGGFSPEQLSRYHLLGELSLEGRVRRVRGVLPMAVYARSAGFTRIVLPRGNAAEAAVVDGLEIYPVETLEETVSFLRGESEIKPFSADPRPLFAPGGQPGPDFSEVRGQDFAKRVLEVAVAGGHNLLFVGPPGAGKTMLARRVPAILPPMTMPEAIETSQVYSLAGLLPEEGLVTGRPFRGPHHTVSDVALIGGGQFPRPGEVSLAHNGVLFLDELPEFNRRTLEVLRQPLEEGVVHISRARSTASFPASFMLIGAMNPCPCGNLGHPRKRCRCPAAAVQKYRARLSGPLLDRIDMHIEVPPVPVRALTEEAPPAESSAEIAGRVGAARRRQAARYAGGAERTNSDLSGRRLRECCRLDPEARNLLRSAVERFELSARSYDRICKVARTIADLEGAEAVLAHHVSEALQYRALDRKAWF